MGYCYIVFSLSVFLYFEGKFLIVFSRNCANWNLKTWVRMENELFNR